MYHMAEQFQPIKTNSGDATVGYFYLAWYPFGVEDKQVIRYDKRRQVFEWCEDGTVTNPNWELLDIHAFTESMDSNYDVLEFVGGLQLLIVKILRGF